MLQGYVDSISADRLILQGWVQAGPNGAEPQLHLDRDGTKVGHAVFGPERVDVSAALGITNRRFQLMLDRPLDERAAFLKAHQVVAISDNESSVIPLGGATYIRLMEDFVKAEAATIPGAREALLGALGANEPRLAKYLPEVRSSAQAGELSYLGFPVGLRSSNDVAQIGRDGHLFLTGGSNALRDQYLSPTTPEAAAELEAKARAWSDAFTNARRSLDGLGIPSLEIIIPEKLTALRHLAPMPIDGPTPLFRRVDELMSGQNGYVNFLDLFENWSEDIGAWQKNDTHCSPAGSLAMLKVMLEQLPGCDPQILDGVELSDIVYEDGDMSAKFFDIPLWDKQYRPAPGALGDSEVTNVYSHTPGHFVGSHNIWTNEDAPIKKKVVVFGNSFFGAVTRPTRLGWWFGRLFSEYHLRWDNAVDLDYVRDVRPDYVIYQTIERFLRLPPATVAAD